MRIYLLHCFKLDAESDDMLPAAGREPHCQGGNVLTRFLRQHQRLLLKPDASLCHLLCSVYQRRRHDYWFDNNILKLVT